MLVCMDYWQKIILMHRSLWSEWNETFKNRRNRHQPQTWAWRLWMFVPFGAANNSVVSVYEIPPLKSAYPYHYHHKNEETLYIISGKGVLLPITTSWLPLFLPLFIWPLLPFCWNRPTAWTFQKRFSGTPLPQRNAKRQNEIRQPSPTHNKLAEAVLSFPPITWDASALCFQL